MVKKSQLYAILVFIFLIIARLFSMSIVPLNDSTEARYAEIARIMLETGNWITPMHRYGEPFWAKPPLSTWLSAFSMQCFGVSELAARLPGLLLSIGIVWLVWHLAKVTRGARVALNSALILSGSLYFLLDAGTVMTDPSLLFCITLSMVAFWHAVVRQSKPWGFIFFIGLGLGLLAKGPIAVVLIGLPIFFWVLLQNFWKELWYRLPWFLGILLMLGIALPWYILAEIRTPGFIKYFIVGEHIMRFLQPGWDGDKYGFAHIAPYGMIWLYALLGTVPWSIVGFILFIKNLKHPSALFGKMSRCLNLVNEPASWLAYLLLCSLLPLCFFTFASNIIYPYVFPSLPALALLIAELTPTTERNFKKILCLSSVTGMLFVVASLAFYFAPQYIAKSQNRVVALFNTLEQTNASKLIYWAYHLDYSAQFYSLGHAVSVLDENNLNLLLSEGGPHYIVEDSEFPIPLPNLVQSRMKYIAMIPVLKKKMKIYRIEST